jgi:hypothetical protein
LHRAQEQLIEAERLAQERASRRVESSEHVDCTDLHWELDPFAMGKVFRNILEYALDATPVADEPEIEVKYSLSRVGDSEPRKRQ